jgi:mRNA interferase MazF
MEVVAARPPRRGEAHLVDLDPTRGAEMKKTRPCVIVSPDELNAHLRTAIVAPLTSAGKPLPFRVACRFENTAGHIVLDQLRTVDRERLIRRLGKIPDAAFDKVLAILQEMFAP